MPDVGVDLTFNELELIQTIDGLPVVRYCDGFRHLKAARIEKPDVIRSIAQYQ